MKSFKNALYVLAGMLIVATVSLIVAQNTDAATYKHQVTVTKIQKVTPKKVVVNKQVISKNIQGTWYFYDIAGRKHVMVITGNTLKLDNQKAFTVGKNNFSYYYSDGIYQLGFDYSDNGYSFRLKTQKINGQWVKTLKMISANYTGTRVMTRNHSHHFGSQDFYN